MLVYLNWLYSIHPSIHFLMPLNLYLSYSLFVLLNIITVCIFLLFYLLFTFFTSDLLSALDQYHVQPPIYLTISSLDNILFLVGLL